MNRLLTKKILAFMLFQISFSNIFSQTFINQNIVQNTVWTKEGSPYIVNKRVVISNGVKLDVFAGSTIIFQSKEGMLVNGEVNILGNLQEPVSIESQRDNRLQVAYCFKVQNNGTLNLNYCYQKNAFTFVDMDQDAGEASFQNCKFEANFTSFFGRRGKALLKGSNSNFIKNKNAILNLRTAIDSCTFDHIESSAVWPIKNSTITNSNFIATGQRALELLGNDISIANCTFDSNRTAIYILNDATNIILQKNQFTRNERALELTADTVQTASIFNNSFCNNDYHIFNRNQVKGKLNISQNCWCSNDTVSIKAKIFSPDLTIINPFHISCRPCILDLPSKLSSICKGKLLKLSANFDEELSSSWYFGSNRFDTIGKHFKINIPLSFSDTVYYAKITVSNPKANCSVSDSIKIQILNSNDDSCRICKVAIASKKLATCSDQALELKLDSASKLWDYQWLPMQNISETNISNPIFRASNTSNSSAFYQYVVSITDVKARCRAVDSVLVEVRPKYSENCEALPELVIYNFITPNLDDKNRTFYIKNLELYSPIEVQIYDRWGLEVFSSPDYKNNWECGLAIEGTYFYKVTVKKLNQEKSGTITIFKGK